jgi:outer membrane lipoprotein-sorting protein
MRVSVRCALLAATTMFVMSFYSSASGRDVMEIVERARLATALGKDIRATVTFEIVNARGEIVQWTGSYYRRNQPDARVRLVLDAPADLRGVEVVTRPTKEGISSTRIYLPSLRRVRELVSDMRGESFLGTDFNYEDLGFQGLEYSQYALSEATDPDGRSCYRVDAVPQQGWWYGRISSCIDRKTFLPLRTEYYDRSGVLWKIRTLAGIETIASHPTPTVITMQTVPAGTLTRITLSHVQYDTGLADVLFEPPYD